MPIDPSLITDTMARWQVPQVQIPDPLQNYAKLQALQNGIQTQQLNQLALQKARADADQRQRDLNDQQILQRAAQDPATMKAVTHWDGQSPFPLAGSGLSFKAMQDMQAKVLADQKAALQWSDEQSASNLKKTARVGDALAGLMYDDEGKPRADDVIASAAPGVISKLQTEGTLPQGQTIPPVTGFADLNKYALANNYTESIGKYAAAARKTAAETAEAQGKAANEQAQAAQKVRQQDATDLETVFTRGGPGAFLAAVSSLPADRAKPFAGAKSVDDIRNAAMSAEQLTTAAQAKANAAETAKRDAAEQAIARGHLSVAQASEARQNREFQTKYGTPESRAMLTASVLRDPDSYFSLSSEQKTGVAADLVASGRNVPVQIPSDLKTRAVSADLGLKSIARIRQIMQDPDMKNATGPVWGRLGNVEQQIGDTYFGQGTAQAAKEQELRTNFATLKMLETKGVLGGRPAAKLVDALSSVMASPNKAPALIDGALNSMQMNLGNVKDETRAYSMGGASNTGAPAAGGAWNPPAGARIQHNPQTGKERYTTDGGKTWVVQP